MSLVAAPAAQIKVDIFKQGPQPQKTAEDIQHPEGIKQQQDDDEQSVYRLGHKQTFDDAVFVQVKTGIDDFKGIGEDRDENRHQNGLKKEDVEMADDPLGGAVVPLADLVHEFIKAHRSIL